MKRNHPPIPLTANTYLYKQSIIFNVTAADGVCSLELTRDDCCVAIDVDAKHLLGCSHNRPEREVQSLLDRLCCLGDLVQPVRLCAAAHDEQAAMR